MAGIRWIFLDLDNTLLDFNQAEAIALAKTLRDQGIEPTREVVERYSRINLAQWRLLEQGLLARSELKTRRFRLLFEAFGLEASPEKASADYERLLGIGHYFMEGAPELLEELYGSYELYLVTNGTAASQKGRLASADMEKYFREIFISEEVGYDKPNREYFECCFRRIPGFRRKEALILGDSLSSDIQGGKNAGIGTVWFNPQGLPNTSPVMPDYEIRRLSELPGLLRRLAESGTK